VRYRRLGRTNLEVSEIGLGGSRMGGRNNERPIEEGVKVVHRAMELGVNFIDTAPLYGRGYSEQIIGAALEGIENPPFIATKLGYLPEGFDYSYDTCMRCFDDSLKRLRRENVTLLQIHEADRAGWEGVFGKGKALEALKAIRDEGRCRFIGITGYDPDVLADMLETGEFDSVLNFLHYDLLGQAALRKLVPTAAKLDAGIILGSPLHMGVLTARRDEIPAARGRLEDEDIRQRLAAVLAILEEYREPLSVAGLKFLLFDERVSVAIPAAERPQEVEENVAGSGDAPFPASLRRKILSL